jgi:hypothetical protein
MNNTITGILTDSQLSQFNQLAHRLNHLGLNLLVFDRQQNCVFQSCADAFQSDPKKITEDHFKESDQMTDPDSLHWFTESILACPIKSDGPGSVWAVVEMAPNRSEESSREKDYLECILEEFAGHFCGEDKVPQQFEKFSNELSRAYEEIMLLYNLSTNMKVTQSSASYLQMACDQLTQLVPVEGIAIFVERTIENQKQLALSAGSGVMVIDPVQADLLQMYLHDELVAGNEGLVDSDVETPFKYEWPDSVRNIIAVPLGHHDRMLGYLVATNVMEKPDFDTTDIKLFSSVANECMVFIENNRLFDELKELFIGCLKALTNSIDAKDQYTRGHSERVAFISRWIAERLSRVQPLSDKQIHHVYLAGLLHDVGKIGIGESVLRKNGRLSDEEYAVIQSHPRIGASILSGIRQMEEVVPGVLSHHERIDGKGYPHGLKGQQIPLIAKIISLADAFDAMTSRRVYRDAMNLQKALSIIENGMGTQFDEEVARVFLDSDINKLWEIIQDGFIESWDYSNFDEYGVEAVGALVR